MCTRPTQNALERQAPHWCRLVGTVGKGIKAWHVDTKRMVAHVRLDPSFPDVRHVACSPADPSFACASSSASGAPLHPYTSLSSHSCFGSVHFTVSCILPDSISRQCSNSRPTFILHPYTLEGIFRDSID